MSGSRDFTLAVESMTRTREGSAYGIGYLIKFSASHNTQEMTFSISVPAGEASEDDAIRLAKYRLHHYLRNLVMQTVSWELPPDELAQIVRAAES